MLVEEPYRYEMTDFDREMFRLLVPPDHPLVAAEREIDWEELRQSVEALCCPDRGQPAIDPVRMLKLEFLRYWHNLSEKQVVERTKTDLAFRYFLRVGHTFRPPHPTSLVYFRGRLGEKGFRRVFDGLVAQSRRAGLVKDRLRLKDASHVIANVAIPTTLTLVAQIRDQLLAASDPFDPVWVAGQQIEVKLLRERTHRITPLGPSDPLAVADAAATRTNKLSQVILFQWSPGATAVASGSGSNERAVRWDKRSAGPPVCLHGQPVRWWAGAALVPP